MGWLDNLYDSIFSENGESDYNSEERFSYREREQPNRRVSSGWADYENFVGGPIKIVNKDSLRYNATDQEWYIQEHSILNILQMELLLYQPIGVEMSYMPN